MKLRYIAGTCLVLLIGYASSLLYRSHVLQVEAKAACKEALDGVASGKVMGVTIINLPSSRSLSSGGIPMGAYLDELRQSLGELRSFENIRVKLSRDKLGSIPNTIGIAYCVADVRFAQGSAVISLVLAMKEWPIWKVEFFVQN